MKTNNESAWPMMRAVTKRAARAMAMLTRVSGERRRTMVKKRARAARAMVTRVVDGEDGDGDGGNMVRNNDAGLVPIIVQQAVLYSASASLDNAGNDELIGRRLAHVPRTDDDSDRGGIDKNFF